MAGWIKLHRKILENPLWLSEPFTRAQAWVDLLLIANRFDSYIVVKGERVKVKKGQVGFSELKLSRRWRWSRTKVRKFLDLIEKEGQIERVADSKTLIITVINYEDYQINHDQEEKESKTTQNGNKSKESKKTAAKKEFSPDVVKIYEFSLKYFDEQFKPKSDKHVAEWKDTIDKLIRIDGKGKKEICEVIKWARNDSFWAINFRSLKKLRQKDKQDTMYYDVFNLKRKKSGASNLKKGQIHKSNTNNERQW
ncbi:MAG: hypothetical protein K9J21_06815 [Bacteroidales bacterium]|nr:hypothetical protein [Bacteroidales bacterium]